MKKQLLVTCCLLIFLAGTTRAQLSGVYSVPGSYTSVAAAINDLNTQGVSGAVTINIAAGYTETTPIGGFTLTATGTLANPITFMKSGAGVNPLITAYAGGTATPISILQDGIWSLIGSDYITIDGIDLVDPNLTNPSTMEYGYGFFKSSATDGCRNNTIKNCVITLNKINNALGSGPATDGSRGINSVNSTINAQTTALLITSASGSNSNNKFYSNTIQNTNIGIALIGYADITPFANADLGNDIGGSSSTTGNTIVNFGGGAAVSPAAGVRTLAQYNINVSFNTILNNNGSGANHAAIIRGIYLNTAQSANATISNNTLTIKSAVTTAQVSMIENVSGATAASNTVSITNNLIANCTNTAATTGIWYGIWNNAASCSNLNITNNTFSNNTTNATSGTTYLIYNSGAVTLLNNITNNNLSFSHAGVTAYSGVLYNIYNSSSTINTTLNITNNNFTSYTHNIIGTGTMYFIYNGGSSYIYNLSNNSFSNLTLNHSGTEIFMYNLSSTQYSLSVMSNTITNIIRNGAAGTTYCYYSSASSLPTSTQTIMNNLFSNITSTVAGTGTFYSMYNSDGGTAPYPKKTVSSNTITNINFNSTGTYYCLYTNYLGEGTTTSGSNIFNNKVSNITTNGTIYGLYLGAQVSANYPGSMYTNTLNNVTSNGAASTIYASYIQSGGSGVNFFKNKIYDVTQNGATGSLYGMYLTSSPSSNIYNNLVGSISTPSSTGVNRLNGVYSAAGNNNLYFNSVYLSGTSTGANFGSNAIYAATTSTVKLINNIFVNNCTPTGTEFAVAYRRSSTTLSTYAPSSNNNLFYAGTPSASNLIYHDGTTPQQTLANYQATVTPLDNLSVTENPTFVSTVGSNPNFLNINAATPTQIESGGTTISGITTDYINTVRNPSTPDIGAWEGTFTPSVICSGSPNAGISAISTPTGCPNLAFTLSNSGQSTGAGISYQWQSGPTATGPWTNIIGANGSTYTLTSAVNSFFQLIVTCANSALSATTTPVSFTVVNPGPCVCNNFGTSNATSVADEEILNVTFGTLNSSSTCTTVAPGPGSLLNQYSNYSGFVTPPTVVQGQSVPFSFQIGTCGGNFGNAIAAFIDYNQNGLFTDAGEQVYVSSASTTGPHFETGNITIPMTASVGTTRMRVISVETGAPASILPTGIYTWGETEDYCIDIILSNLCTGTPTTGVATINTPTGCPSTAFAINATSVTVAGGITYQWQSAPSATGPWSAITNATNTSYASSTPTTTYYQMVTTCSVTTLSNTTSVVSFSVINPGPCVCGGYTTSAASSTADEDILNVTFDVLNSTSSCTTIAPGVGSIQNRYSNYVGFLAAPTVTQGQTVPFSFQIGTCGGNFNNCIAAYIDYNQNGLFTDAGEQVYLSSAATNGPHFEIGNITIPMTASVGTTRMRIVNVETSSPAAITPTNIYTWGETEDYCVDIALAQLCSGAPASGTAAINTPSGCPSVTFNINTTGNTTGLGIQYQWYSSPSATGPWGAITNATNTSYASSTISTTYYQMVTTCTVSAMTATSSVVSFSVVNPGPCVCAGYGISAATNAADEEILNVTFGTLNSTSTCTTLAPGPGSILQRYSNYSGSTSAPTVLLGQSVPFNIQVGTCGGNFNSGVSVFIDYNQNGLFTDAGEQAFLSAASTNGPYFATGNILIPVTASVGITRMRVVNMETTTMASILPTGTYGYGETEDYCIDIQPCVGPPSAPTTTGVVICSGNTATITATPSSSGTAQWYSSATATNYIAQGTVFVTPVLVSNTMYYVKDSTLCGISAATAVNVTVTPLPSVLAVTASSICSGNSTTLSAMVTGTAQWFATSTPTAAIATGTLFTTPIINNTTTYYVRDTSICGTSTVTAITVTVIPSPTVNISVSPSNVICSGSSVVLTASGANSYTWNTSATSAVINPTLFTSTSYSVIASSTTCPGNYTASIFITVNPNPTITIVPGSMSICAGTSLTLSASGSILYNWNTSATTTSISVSPTVNTTYSVIGTAGNNCTATAVVNITVNAKPTVSISAASNTACLNGGPVSLTGSPAGGVFSGPNVSGSNLMPSATGMFNPVYTFTNSAGCANSATASIVVSVCTEIVSQSAKNISLKVYPNPNFGSFTIETGNSLRKTIELTDLAGKIVHKETSDGETINMNITELANGVYHLRISSESGIDIIKVVKQ